MRNPFRDHPAAVGESYFQHMGAAFGFAGQLLGAAFACFVHGLFPFLFTSTGSTTVKRLHDRMIAARRARSGADAAAGRSGGLIAVSGDRAQAR